MVTFIFYKKGTEKQVTRFQVNLKLCNRLQIISFTCNSVILLFYM